MSEELDWELYDIFEAGLFPFPIYDHQTARKIIRYLLYRGVLDEEIADAIEDSTADLHIWLNRSGKNMVGEWVIAWVNDVRDEYRKEKQREARERGFSWHDYEMGSDVSHSDGDDSSGGEGDDPGASHIRHLHDREAFRVWSQRMRAIDDSNAESSCEGDDYELDMEDDDDLTAVKRRLRDNDTPSLPPESPPPLPHQPFSDIPPPLPTLRTDRATQYSGATTPIGLHSQATMTTTTATQVSMTTRIPLQYLQQLQCSVDSHSQTVSSDISPRSHFLTFGDDAIYQQQTPDSGAVSDIYSGGSIPPDGGHQLSPSPPAEGIRSDTEIDGDNEIIQENQVSSTQNNDDSQTEERLKECEEAWPVVCTQASHMRIANRGIPSCPNCQCSLVHYSIIPKERSQLTSTTFSNIKGGIMNTSEQAQLNLHINETMSRAMQFHIDTLDKDGPGFIFIMTDTVQGFLPWSADQRYKIASSRQPERWLREFRNRNIDIDLIWQVKVRNHLLALREVHTHLQRCHLHSNWFKCSLSRIMDIISRIVRKYRI